MALTKDIESLFQRLAKITSDDDQVYLDEAGTVLVIKNTDGTEDSAGEGAVKKVLILDSTGAELGSLDSTGTLALQKIKVNEILQQLQVAGTETIFTGDVQIDGVLVTNGQSFINESMVVAAGKDVIRDGVSAFATLLDHKVRHQAGGGDEISIAGLAGVASEPQLTRVEEDGVFLANVTGINFVTPGFTLSESAGLLTLSVTGGGGGGSMDVYEGGVAKVPGALILDFPDAAFDITQPTAGTALVTPVFAQGVAGAFAESNDSRFPTANEKLALAGTFGAPDGANKYVTNTDARMSNNRAPTVPAGVVASRPAPGNAGHLYYATDEEKLYRDSGGAWILVGIINWGHLNGRPSVFPPSVHAVEHNPGGLDPINVTGYPGLLAARQTPLLHATQHGSGGDDPLTHSTLVGLAADDHTQYSLADGTRAFTAVVAGVAPTGPTHLSTKGYVDAQVAAVQAQFAPPVQDLTALKAVLQANRQDKQLRLVEDERIIYFFDLGAALGGEAPTDVDDGRWYQIHAHTQDHEVLEGLLGGALNDHFHVTQVQHGSLTTGVSTTLHYHDVDRDRANHTGTQPFTSIDNFLDPLHANIHEVGGAAEINVDGLTGQLLELQDPFLEAGTIGARPAFGTVGRMYFATDEGILYRDMGTTWAKVAVRDYNDLDSVPALPALHAATHAWNGTDPINLFDLPGVALSPQKTGLRDNGALGLAPATTLNITGPLTAVTSIGGIGSINVRMPNHNELGALLGDHHTQYIRVDGVRSLTAPLAGVSPTDPSHLTTRGYVDAQVAQVSGRFGAPVADIPALQAVPNAQRENGQLRLVDADGAVYRFELGATTGGVIPDDIDNGRWYRVTAATPDHNALTNLQGGIPAERFHLTSPQHTLLTTGGDTVLHYHSADRARANHTGTQPFSSITNFQATPHAALHEDGGSAQINVGGLLGELNDVQKVNVQWASVSQGNYTSFDFTGNLTLTQYAGHIEVNVPSPPASLVTKKNGVQVSAATAIVDYVGDLLLVTEPVVGQVRVALNVVGGTGALIRDDDPRLPTISEKAALVGAPTGGAPTGANKYVTDNDSRLPSLTQKSALAGAGLAPPGVGNKYTLEDYARFPTQGEKNALPGTGPLPPSGTNKYVTNDDARMTNARAPTAHAASQHAFGMPDALNVGGLSGRLNDSQFVSLEQGGVPKGQAHTLDLFGASITVAAGVATVTVASYPEVRDGGVSKVAAAAIFDFEGAAFNVSEPVAGKALVAAAFGAAVGTICQGNDPRLSDPRAPTAHASSHWTGGTDPLDHGQIAGLGDDDHPLYVLADGTRAFTGVVQGIDPTASDHLATKLYVDSQTSSISGAYADPVQDLPELRAILASGRTDKQLRLVEDEAALYRFDEQAVSGGEKPDDVAPLGPGRWFRIQTATASHNSLLGLQGGGTGDYHHITGTQRAALIGGISTALHFHASDRDRANHTGTQERATIFDFDHGGEHGVAGGDPINIGGLSGQAADKQLVLVKEDGIVEGLSDTFNFTGAVDVSYAAGVATVDIQTSGGGPIEVQDGGTQVVNPLINLNFHGTYFTITEPLTGTALVTPNVGSGAGVFCAGNDSRLSDARTPTAHASTHFRAGLGGTDPLDHGSIDGLGDDDHPHYSLVDGTRAFTGPVGGVDPVAATDLTTKNYVDTEVAAVTSDHGGLAGLGDDDHVQYALVDGTRAFSGLVSGPALDPTVDDHLARKKYVDDQATAATFTGDLLGLSLTDSTQDITILPASGRKVLINAPDGGGTDDLLQLDVGAIGGSILFRNGVGTFGRFRPEIQLIPNDPAEFGSLTTRLQPGHDTGAQPSFRLNSHVNGSALTARALLQIANNGIPKVTVKHDGTVSAYSIEYANRLIAKGVAADGPVSGPTEAHVLFNTTTGKLRLSEAGGPWQNIGSGGSSDHGALTGLGDDDHAQYSLANGTRAFTGKVQGVSTLGGDPGLTLATKDYVDASIPGGFSGDLLGSALTDSTGPVVIQPDVGQTVQVTTVVEGIDPTAPSHLTTKSYVDSVVVTDHGTLSGLGDDDHAQYSLANGARAFTAPVAGVTPTLAAHLATKAYVDGFTPVTDHGALTGLGDDDHMLYPLVVGTRPFTGPVGGVSPVVGTDLATKDYVDSQVSGGAGEGTKDIQLTVTKDATLWKSPGASLKSVTGGLNPDTTFASYAFDPDVEEYIVHTFQLPDDMKTTGDVDFIISWAADGAPAVPLPGAASVVFEVRFAAIEPGEIYDVPMQVLSTTSTASTTQPLAAEAVIATTLATVDWKAGDTVTLVLARKAAAPADTLTVDALVFGVNIVVPSTNTSGAGISPATGVTTKSISLGVSKDATVFKSPAARIQSVTPTTNTNTVLSAYAFHPDTEEYIVLPFVLPQEMADAGDIRIRLPWAPEGVQAAGKFCRWRIREKSVGDGETYDVALSEHIITAAAPTVVDVQETSEIVLDTATLGWEAGRTVILIISRDATHPGDTVSGDVNLFGVNVSVPQEIEVVGGAGGGVETFHRVDLFTMGGDEPLVRAPVPALAAHNGTTQGLTAMKVYAFDPDVEEYLSFAIRVPDELDSAGRVYFDFDWVPEAAAAGVELVVWKVSFVSASVSMDLPLASFTGSGIASTTIDDITQTTLSELVATMGVSGGDLLLVHISRDSTNPSDTLGSDAELASLTLRFPLA